MKLSTNHMYIHLNVYKRMIDIKLLQYIEIFKTI